MHYQEGLQEYMECNRQLAGAMDRVNTGLAGIFEGLEVSMIDLASRLEDVYAEALKKQQAERQAKYLEGLTNHEDIDHTGIPVSDDGEQLENSMFKDVPPEIKAAAERAGIGIEDLCELALQFVDKRNEAKQKRREDKLKRKELKKEKAIKLSTIEHDYKLRREVDVKVSEVRWGALNSVVGSINTVACTVVRWGSLAAGASFIAYSVTNIFV